MWLVEHSSIPLLPQRPSHPYDEGVESSDGPSCEISSLLEPPVLEPAQVRREVNVYLEDVEASVPNLPIIDTLDKNVVYVILLLQASEAGRGLILQTMSCLPIRSP